MTASDPTSDEEMQIETNILKRQRVTTQDPTTDELMDMETNVDGEAIV